MKTVRLRQVPPVIADRVTDLKRFIPRGMDEEKWYHGFTARLLMRQKHEEGGLSLCANEQIQNIRKEFQNGK